MTSRSSFGVSRLVLKLYLPVTLSVLAISLLGALAGFLNHRAREEQVEGFRPSIRRELASFVVSRLSKERHDPEERQRLAEQLDREIHIDLSVYGVDGDLWVTLGPWALSPLDEGSLDQLRRGGTSLDDSTRMVVSASEGGEIVAYGLVSLPPHIGAQWGDHPRRDVFGLLPGIGRPPYWIPPPILWTMVALLVVLAVVAAAFVRSVAKPLTHLSNVARALGQGDLTARADLKRSDELGDLGRAFDEMADRVTGLLRAQTELMASASHELRTPLARARVALDIASEYGEELAREQLGEIAQDLEELESLVSDILIMARLDLKRGRLDGPRQPLRFEIFSSEEMIDEAIERFHSVHRAHHLEIDMDSDLPSLRADRMLLRRALTNIMDNAAKYSDSKQPVKLVVHATESAIEVGVIDRGIGISEEDCAKIFTPFFRADRSRTRATGGVGLGLALARRIIEAHNGTISVESTLARGSTFHMTIPLSSAEKTS